MVSERMWSAISRFTKLFPPKLLKYNNSIITVNEHYFKQLWFWFYFINSPANWAASILIPVYRLAYLDLSRSDTIVHQIIFIIMISITSLCIVSLHTMVLNTRYFFSLFNTLSLFQRHQFGKFRNKC